MNASKNNDGWTGEICPDCKGSGRRNEEERCNSCGGTGEEYISELDKRDEA